ncbi:MAG: hypothetical protein ACXVIP_05565 [Halobacteriota archaeon]
MLAAELYHKSVLNSRDPALSEIYSSTISLHHAKEGYDYPTIRLPHILSKLAGLPTRIYQTLHEGALAFLVVIAPSNSASEKGSESPKSSVFTRRRSPVRIQSGPSPDFDARWSI